MKISDVKINGKLYGVGQLTPDTLAEFVKDISSSTDPQKVMNKYGVYENSK